MTNLKNFFFLFLLCCTTIIAAQDTCTFVIELGEDINLNPGDSIELNLVFNVPSDAIAEINWTPDSSLSCTDCTRPIIKPEENTCYMVAVTDTSGCTVSDTLCVFVEPVSNQNLAPPEQLTLFPNPSSDIFIIKSDIHPILEISIYDALGQKILDLQNIKTRQQTIEVAHWKPGTYYVAINRGNQIAFRKILKL